MSIACYRKSRHSTSMGENFNFHLQLPKQGKSALSFGRLITIGQYPSKRGRGAERQVDAQHIG